jgi:hypothetical protein
MSDPGQGGMAASMARVVVIGCAGSGKSTLARKLAQRTGLPLAERDSLGALGSPAYLAAISEMAARPWWILDGAPYYADNLVYRAADTVIFLDYPKALVLCRVLRRTLRVELTRRPEGAHRPLGVAAWRDPEHPVRWAWTSHGDRHREGLDLMARPDLAGTQIVHFTRPATARRWLRRLRVSAANRGLPASGQPPRPEDTTSAMRCSTDHPKSPSRPGVCASQLLRSGGSGAEEARWWRRGRSRLATLSSLIVGALVRLPSLPWHAGGDSPCCGSVLGREHRHHDEVLPASGYRSASRRMPSWRNPKAR